MFFNGAGNEIRTRYLHLGKVALCQMSYARTSLTGGRFRLRPHFAVECGQILHLCRTLLYQIEPASPGFDLRRTRRTRGNGGNEEKRWKRGETWETGGCCTALRPSFLSRRSPAERVRREMRSESRRCMLCTYSAEFVRSRNRKGRSDVVVPRVGVEPTTRGFSVRCSTN